MAPCRILGWTVGVSQTDGNEVKYGDSITLLDGETSAGMGLFGGHTSHMYKTSSKTCAQPMTIDQYTAAAATTPATARGGVLTLNADIFLGMSPDSNNWSTCDGGDGQCPQANCSEGDVCTYRLLNTDDDAAWTAAHPSSTDGADTATLAYQFISTDKLAVAGGSLKYGMPCYLYYPDEAKYVSVTDGSGDDGSYGWTTDASLAVTFRLANATGGIPAPSQITQPEKGVVTYTNTSSVEVYEKTALTAVAPDWSAYTVKPLPASTSISSLAVPTDGGYSIGLWAVQPAEGSTAAPDVLLVDAGDGVLAVNGTSALSNAVVYISTGGVMTIVNPAPTLWSEYKWYALGALALALAVAAYMLYKWRMAA